MAKCSMCGSHCNGRLRTAVAISGNLCCKKCLLALGNALEDEPLPELPDDVLLEVFSWLPVRDLLRGPRAVCRRWRTVALSPALWCRRSLDVPAEESALVQSVLRMAPCLESINFNAFRKMHWTSINTACVTDCTVVNLSFELSNYSDNDAESLSVPKLRRICTNQAALGRLRKLDLIDVPRNHAKTLAKIALTLKGLAELKVNISMEAGDTPVPVKAPSRRNLRLRSLKTLNYISDSKDPLFEYLISAHSGSLKSVTVRDEISSRALELLCKCRELRKLDLLLPTTMPPMADLSALTSLNDLSVCLTGSWTHLVSYFRAAVQLTRLSVPYFYDYLHVAIMDVLAALSSSGGSALRELHICLIEDPKVSLRCLPYILPGFTRLQMLYLENVPPGEALDSITSEMVPSLRLICFLEMQDSYDFCGWAECLFPKVCRLVGRIPRLHVAGLLFHCECRDDALVCDCCKRGVHPLALSRHDKHFGLYGHGDGEHCDVTEHRNRLAGCPAQKSSCCSHDWMSVLQFWN